MRQLPWRRVPWVSLDIATAWRNLPVTLGERMDCKLSEMESEALWQRFPLLSMYTIAKWAYSGSSGDLLDIFSLLVLTQSRTSNRMDAMAGPVLNVRLADLSSPGGGADGVEKFPHEIDGRNQLNTMLRWNHTIVLPLIDCRSVANKTIYLITMYQSHCVHSAVAQ